VSSLILSNLVDWMLAACVPFLAFSAGRSLYWPRLVMAQNDSISRVISGLLVFFSYFVPADRRHWLAILAPRPTSLF